MRRDPGESLYDWLAERVEAMADGERLPTVRALMQHHGVGQAAVQQAFARLKARGLISAQVGRGSYVTRPGQRAEAAAAAGLQSLLILSNASMNERAVRVQNRLVEQVHGSGGRVVQLSYHDTGHLMELLQSVPRFDAAILQSHYEVMPIRLLALLQQKSRALAVDGHSVAGVDIDHVGIDWAEALGPALDRLTALGHRRIRLVTLDVAAQPIVSARRHVARLRDWRGLPLAADCVALSGQRHPSQPVLPVLGAALPDLARDVTALLFLGMTDGLGIRDSLAAAGLSAPRDLSVVVLGHPDVPTEHLGEFAISGGSHAEAAALLIEILRRRLTEPARPPEVHYLRNHWREGVTLGPAPAASRSPA